MRQSSSWWRRMRSDIDGKSILINCSMVRTRTPPFSWMTHLMALYAEDSRIRGQRSLEKDERGQSDGPWWYPNQGVEVSRAFSYSMGSTISINRTRCLRSGEEAYWYRSTRIRETSKVALIIGELSWWATRWSCGRESSSIDCEERHGYLRTNLVSCPEGQP